MSLDVYLNFPGAIRLKPGQQIFIREDGQTKEISREEWDQRYPGRDPVVLDNDEDCETGQVYHGNITHNLNTMASAAGLYTALWRPEDLKITTAKQLIPLLEEGLLKLCADPEFFKQFTPSNGWGDYLGLIRFVRDYLRACRTYPEALVNVWR